jgi:predicted phage tail protein
MPGFPTQGHDVSESLRTIRLYGKMGSQFGRVHRLAVKTPVEAVRALSALYPGFQQYMTTAHLKGVEFAVFVGKRNLSKDELTHPTGDNDIRIAPVLKGSKSGGVLNIVLGAVFIALSFIPGIGQAAQMAMMSAGIGMAAGGVVQLLSPQLGGLGSKDSPENKAGYSFNGPVNTEAQGNPVPLLYGRLIVGSAVISASIRAQDASTASAYHPPGGYWRTIGVDGISASSN